MKNSLFTLLLLSSLPLMAANFSEDTATSSGFSSYQKEVTKVILCARDLVQNHYEGSTRRSGAAIILTDLIGAYQNNSDVSLIKSSCESMKDFSKLDYEFAVEHSETKASEEAARIVNLFISPTTSCTGGYFGTSVSVAVGVSFSMAGEKCAKTDGRRWIQFMLGAGGNLGLGAYVGVGYTQDKKVTDRTVVTTNTHDFSNASLVVLGASSSYSVDYFFDERIPEDGYGVGVGFAAGTSADLGLKILPLTNDKKLLLNLLK